MTTLNNKLLTLAIGFLIIFSNNLSFAEGDKILRFVSTRSNEVNARKGPGINYPIIYIFINKFEPLAVIQEFNEWRKVLDYESNESWIHSSLLSTKRYAVVSADGIHDLYRFATKKSRIVARIEKNTRCKLEKVSENFCLKSVDGYKGWIDKKALWGLMPSDK
ncbi:MAG: hypothetical protein K9G11_01915 [Rickettsiaceae bacterium]|nr:hypothetical protein [Rickettsiaceae bacterium]